MKNKKVSLSIERQEEKIAFLFIAPFVLGFLIFRVVPIIYAFFISFTNFNSLRVKQFRFVGLENYIEVFKDSTALLGYAKAFYFVLLYVPGIVIFSLGMAMLFNKQFYCRYATRTMILIPYISNIVAVSVVWTMLLDPYGGPINNLLKVIGIKNPPMWLADQFTVLPTLATIKIWYTLAFTVIVFWAALQDIPKELYEAADIDGVTTWQKFKHVTFPLVSPTTFFLTVTSIINSFKTFDLIRNFTNGGPGLGSRVITLNIYETAFQYNKFSYASAQAVLLFIVIFIITIIQWKGQKKWVHY